MERKTYTIQEVISFITSLPFQKFSHPCFSSDEYIYGDGEGHLCDENGYQLPQGEFWNLRMKTMKDGKLAKFGGLLDENYEGEITMHIDCINDNYDTDDIEMWIEIPKC